MADFLAKLKIVMNSSITSVRSRFCNWILNFSIKSFIIFTFCTDFEFFGVHSKDKVNYLLKIKLL